MALKYQPELDGLRAIAVIAVVLFHSARHGPISGGFVGVDLFFVLSAFLICSVLERNPNLWRFYWHRFCRLMPALLFMLGGYLVVAPFVGPDYSRHGADALLAGAYLSDYSFAFYKVPWFLQHTWSLAVEEHFYLLWPALFLPLLRAKNPTLILVAAYVVMTAWRIWNPDWLQYYYRFDTHATGLILGAILFFARPKLTQLSAYAALAALAIIAVTTNIEHSSVVITLAELASSLLICAPPPWLANPVLVWLGKRSYAIYLWHFPIAYAVRQDHRFALTAAVTLALSIMLAAASYVTAEAAGRRLKMGAHPNRILSGCAKSGCGRA